MNALINLVVILILVSLGRILKASKQGIKPYCSHGNIQRGVSIQSSSTREILQYIGVVTDINACMRHCCYSKHCDMALMLNNRCYKVKCAQRKDCKVVKLRRGDRLESQLVKIKKYHKDLFGEENLVDSLTMRTKSNDGELLCTHSPISTNVTLRGGIKAGNFSNLGEVESMHMCTALCCAQSTCDLAFMIGDTCVAVECQKEELCQTVRARPSIKYKTKISYVRRREIDQNVKKAKIASTQTQLPNSRIPNVARSHAILMNHKPGRITYTTNLTSCTITKLLTNVTLRHGLDGENYKLLGRASTMEQCIAMGCNNIGGNTAFLLGTRCYVVLCPREHICDTIGLRTGVTSKIAFLQKPRSSIYYNGIDRKIASEMRHNLCSGKRIMLDHTIKGGVQAGHFTEIFGIDSIENCTALCCRERHCEMAMLLNNVCYIGHCHDKEKCKVINVLHVRNIISHIGFKIGLQQLREQENHVTSAPSTHKIISYRLPQTTILKTSTCSAEKIYHNVTLIGGMKAANITALGKASNMQECIGLSCDYGKGDLVLMLGHNCYTVKCVNQRVCQTAPAQPSKFFSRVAYLKWGSTINETDLTLDQSERKRYPRCSRSHILHNHTLKGGLRAGNFSVISQVDSIENCAAICCNEQNCDLAFMLGDICYIGDCANTELCSPVPVYAGANVSSQIAFIANPRKITENENIKDYSMIYILVGSLAMVISLVGLLWSIRLCVTRKYLRQEKDRLSLMDEDGESLQDYQMYSPSHWSRNSGLHSVGGKYANNGPLFLSDSESEDESGFTALEEYKKQRAEHDTTLPHETMSPNNVYNETSYIDMVNALNQKVRKNMRNL